MIIGRETEVKLLNDAISRLMPNLLQFTEDGASARRIL